MIIMSQVLSDIVGGKWWKVDFHLHTPASYDYGHGDETVKSITAKQFIEQCRARKLDCIVVSAPSTKYDIHFISGLDNKDQVGETSPERFSTWNNYKIPFRGGDQILDITLPSCAIVE